MSVLRNSLYKLRYISIFDLQIMFYTKKIVPRINSFTMYGNNILRQIQFSIILSGSSWKCSKGEQTVSPTPAQYSLVVLLLALWYTRARYHLYYVTISSPLSLDTLNKAGELPPGMNARPRKFSETASVNFGEFAAKWRSNWAPRKITRDYV